MDTGECTTCGTPASLLAVADVLVVKALEATGKWIVRADRSRYAHARAHGVRLHEAHVHWPLADDALVARALRGAWDVVPALVGVHGCCGATGTEVVALLDRYVRDLVITGTPHRLGELRYRFAADLRMVIPVETTADLVGATHA